ncbi:patatin-like phospholipase family protein [Poseidonocella sp. HB161398]|uniref:patatin-like phospholipase family protein n=1 Tax=Poseidonocella sp. HB161398 TaxID=2320855 RepID=UPI0011088F22|nr:patatin-like phospholipase family protein [Poseidonocella sp. HB161398]
MRSFCIFFTSNLPIASFSLLPLYLMFAPQSEQLITALNERSSLYSGFFLPALALAFSVLISKCASSLRWRIVLSKKTGWRIADRIAILIPAILYLCLALKLQDGWPLIGWAAFFVVVAAWYRHTTTNRGTSFEFLLSKSTPKLILLLIMLTLWIGLVAFSLLNPIEAGRFLGVNAVLIVFLGLIISAVSFLLTSGARGITAFAVAFSILAFWNNPHEMSIADYHPPANQLSNPLPKWLLTRNDLRKYKDAGRPYPILVVASEGGGGYAALHAYAFHRKAQEICPTYTQHLFAAIGVSGGAVGNYLANFKNKSFANPKDAKVGCNPLEFTPADITDELTIMSEDLLSPLAYTLAFRDFPNRLLFGMLSEHSRVDIFREMLLGQTERLSGVDSSSFKVFSAFWNGVKGDSSLPIHGPAQIPLATHVATGQQFAFSPLDLTEFGISVDQPVIINPGTGLVDIMKWNVEKDISLIDAVMASAAFPYVTPAIELSLPFTAEMETKDGLIDFQENRRYSLVDGGYADGSGLTYLLKIHDGAGHHSLVNFEIPNLTKFWEDLSGELGTFSDGHIELLNEYRDCKEVKFSVRSASPPKVSFALGNEKAWSDCAVLGEIYYITLGSADGVQFANAGKPLGKQRSETLQNFVLDPLLALAAARTSRNEEARVLTERVLCGDCLKSQLVEFSQSGPMSTHLLDVEAVGLPLGWDMPLKNLIEATKTILPSTETQKEILKEIPRHWIGTCNPNGFSDSQWQDVVDLRDAGGFPNCPDDLMAFLSKYPTAINHGARMNLQAALSLSQ